MLWVSFLQLGLYLGLPPAAQGSRPAAWPAQSLRPRRCPLPAPGTLDPQAVQRLFYHLPNSRAYGLGIEAGVPCVDSAEATARSQEGPASLEAQPGAHLIQMFVLRFWSHWILSTDALVRPWLLGGEDLGPAGRH